MLSTQQDSHQSRRIDRVQVKMFVISASIPEENMGSFSIWHWLIVLIIISPVLIGLATMGLQKKVILKHQPSGLVKTGYYGFSWTYLLFGWIVPIFRGEIGIGALHFLFTLVSFGLFQIIMPFLYNKQYTSRLLTSGWALADTEQNNQIARVRLGMSA